MIFAASKWFWALIFCVALYVWKLVEAKKRRGKLAKFIDPSHWAQIIPDADWKARPKKALLWSLALVLFCVALARPQWGVHEETIKVSGMDVMIALDVSNSMEVEDVVPNRMKKAQHLIRSIAERLSGDRLGVVAFAGSSYLASPLTTDVSYVLELLQNLGPKSVTTQGTDIGIALETVSRALERGAEQSGEKDGTRAVILITDGEDLEEKALEGAQLLKASGAKLYILGVGTEKGGPIPIRDEGGALKGYKRDGSNEPVVSRLSPEVLSKIAQAGDGQYWTATADERELDELMSDLNQLNRTDRAEKRRVIREERFQIPLLLGLLLLFWELSVPLRLALRLSVIAFLIFPGTLKASSLDVYQENEKGVRLFKEGKVEQAQESFGRAQAQDPHKPELLYNQGVIQMGQKDAEKAAQGFEDAAQGALQRGDPALASKSFYNLGGTQASKGDVPGAIRSYLNAIDAAQKAKDPELEEDARKRIELMIRQQQKQQQQKSESQNKDQSSDGEQKDKKDPSDPNKKSDANSGGKPQQNQKGQAPRPEEKKKQQGFNSKKLSKEDADRVMNELSAREKDLQGKLKKQKGRAQPPGRDW